MKLPRIQADLIRCGDRADWLLERRNRLHSTDCARVLAEKELLAVFADKTAPFSDDEPEEWQRIKLASEATVRTIAQWKFGGKVHAWPATTIAVSREHPWLACTPDGLLVVDDHAGPGIHQIKCWSELDRDTWREGRPLYVQVQNQIELLVTGCTWGATDVMFGTQVVERFEFAPDPTFLALALPALKSFWDSVLLGEQPAPTGSTASRAALRRLHPNDNGLTVQLDDSVENEMQSYDIYRDEVASNQAKVDAIENQLRAALGDNTFGVTPAGRWISWKTNAAGDRVFGRSRPKGEIEYAPGSVRNAADYANAPTTQTDRKRELFAKYQACRWCGEKLKFGSAVIEESTNQEWLACKGCHEARAFDVAIST